MDGLAPRRAPLAQVRQAVAALQVRLGRGGVYDANVTPVVCFIGDSLEAASLTEGETIICGVAALLDVLTRAKHQPPARVVDVAGVVRALADGHAGQGRLYAVHGLPVPNDRQVPPGGPAAPRAGREGAGN